jgi:hypothetical protein
MVVEKIQSLGLETVLMIISCILMIISCIFMWINLFLASNIHKKIKVMKRKMGEE